MTETLVANVNICMDCGCCLAAREVQCAANRAGESRFFINDILSLFHEGGLMVHCGMRSG